MLNTNEFVNFKVGYEWDCIEFFGELDENNLVAFHGKGVQVKVYYPSEGGGGVGREHFNDFNSYHAEELLKLILCSEEYKKEDYHLVIESEDDLMEVKWDEGWNLSIGIKTLGARARRNGNSTPFLGMKWSTLKDADQIERFKSFLMIYAGINKWGINLYHYTSYKEGISFDIDSKNSEEKQVEKIEKKHK